MEPLWSWAMVSRLLILTIALINLVPFTDGIGFDGIPGDYCKLRRPVQCCTNRNDDCTAPILGNHLCYCDMFCHRRPDSDDCCPDFRYVCRGEVKPTTTVAPLGECRDQEGNRYFTGTHNINCNICKCPQTGGLLQCESETACLIQTDILAKIKSNGLYTWRASNYSEFWGQTLANGIRYRLGTLFPTGSVQNMNDILIEPSSNLPENFDARTEWPNYIHPVRNQGNCGSSWVFSTTAVSADRLAIQSKGKLSVVLSSQQILSCNQHRREGCSGGHLDRAWWYLRKLGVVTEECYPYTSGATNEPGFCRVNTTASHRGAIVCPSGSKNNKIYKMTPPYKISSKEEEIKDEIFRNGPVQATFLVHEDFYMYKSGVYQHLNLAAHKAEQYRKSGYHSVRILGWGVDYSYNQPIKYWLCANSWGTAWGENGLFKILRGQNHCQIETFILGAWGKGSLRRRRLKFHKVRRLRKRIPASPFHKF